MLHTRNDGSILASEHPANAAARLTELANGMRIAQALYVVAELRIADFGADGVVTANQLAAVTETNPSALTRLLRALCAIGIFVENRAGHFALTNVGMLL